VLPFGELFNIPFLSLPMCKTWVIKTFNLLSLVMLEELMQNEHRTMPGMYVTASAELLIGIVIAGWCCYCCC
jgi:hypothetical protein